MAFVSRLSSICLQTHLIGNDARQPGRIVRLQRNARPIRQRARDGNAALDDEGGVEVGEGQLPHAGLPGVAQHGVDHAERMARTLVDVARIGAIARIRKRAEVLVLHDLGVGDDGTDRRSQLMRQPRRQRDVVRLAVTLVRARRCCEVGRLLSPHAPDRKASTRPHRLHLANEMKQAARRPECQRLALP